MMKKVNINFILTLILPTVLVVVAIATKCWLVTLEAELDGLKTEMDVELQAEEIDDVAGYGLIAQSFGYTAGMVIFIVAELFFVILPSIFAIILFVPALIARCIYSERKGRLLAYRILMGIEYTLVGLIGLACIFIFHEGDALLIGLTGLGCCLAITVTGSILTYTKPVKG